MSDSPQCCSPQLFRYSFYWRQARPYRRCGLTIRVKFFTKPSINDIYPVTL